MVGVAAGEAFWKGSAGALVDGAGALVGGGVTAWSSTDLGARVCADAICKTNAIPRKSAPDHQLIFVSRLPACRVPMNASGDELTPPKLAAMPVPLPLCNRIPATSTKLSRISTTRRDVCSMGGE